eukprot:Plantae.Rhodophyta-Purpureofilum_apyrenoidigerum.ctg741.p5 GENE.Plantae.Rhodophyta-Purpureofilum_apyrenoidigerum.ctg741~~Plantae.Rhodophyta-Purpureofilum_apyrenoidigerum.ctg741.p5  ORF type:complete len:104 (-),score=30.59 Plantae.Rhodophyta-Purpureofilum_apyrenoidigerum.ctg741:1308-1619(-)
MACHEVVRNVRKGARWTQKALGQEYSVLIKEKLMRAESAKPSVVLDSINREGAEASSRTGDARVDMEEEVLIDFDLMEMVEEILVDCEEQMEEEEQLEVEECV